MDATQEGTIRELAARGELHAAATAAVEGYGREVLGFLVATMRDEDDAGEAFSLLCEDLWRGLPAFRWESSLRTWMYTLARHAAARVMRQPRRRRERRGSTSELEALAQSVRTSTMPWLRTDVKSAVATLRESLSPEDLSLLILRVDRELPWGDIARILASDECADEAGRVRASARLRKRFQLVKDELRARALAAGLVPVERE